MQIEEPSLISRSIMSRTMQLPARYRYDPRWQIVAMSWMFVAALTVASFVSAAYAPQLIGIALSLLAVFSMFGLATTVRRYAFARHLTVDEDGIWLPSGFLRANPRRIVFAEVSEVWEAFIPRTVVLCLRSHGKTYELLSTLLADHDTYLEVAGYIYSRVERAA
jgi:hypothetical protein